MNYKCSHKLLLVFKVIADVRMLKTRVSNELVDFINSDVKLQSNTCLYFMGIKN